MNEDFQTPDSFESDFLLRPETPLCWGKYPPYQHDMQMAFAWLTALSKSRAHFQTLFQPLDDDPRLLGSLSHADMRVAIPGEHNAEQAENALERAILVHRDNTGIDASCRINVLTNPYAPQRRPLFVATDPPAEYLKGRVFPFSDEAETLLSQLRPRLAGWSPKNILDLCCGPGHIGLSLSQHYGARVRTVGIDHDPLAIGYAHFNAQLNDLCGFRAETWDLTNDPNSSPLLSDIGPFDLITADPPFTSAPEWMKPPNHSKAGEIGEGLTRDLLRVVPVLLAPGGRFAMITYTLDGKDGPKELYKHLQAAFAGTSIVAEEPHVMQDVFLWRLHGAKRFPRNPMPVQYMAPRYFDEGYITRAGRRDNTYAEYIDWIEETLIGKDLTHLWYVFVTAKRKED